MNFVRESLESGTFTTTRPAKADINRSTMSYRTIEDIRKDLEAKGLIGKSALEIVSEDLALYHRVWNFAKKYRKHPRHVWEQLGIEMKRELPFKNDAELIEWAKEGGLFGKKTCDISHKNLRRISYHAKLTKRSLSELYQLLELDSDYRRVYRTIEDIKSDLTEKGLVGSTIEEVNLFDGSNTGENIRRYARKHGIKPIEMYELVGIRYSDKTKIVNGAAKSANVYNTVEDIRKDLESKGLIGKTMTDVVLHDYSKTYARIPKFAKRHGLDLQTLWCSLGILPSDENEHHVIPNFSSVEEITMYLRSRNIGPELKKLRVQHKKLYQKILEFAKQAGMDRGVIWDKVGVRSALHVLNSIQDVQALLVANGLRNATKKQIRLYDNGSVYQAIYSYASKNNITLTSLWKALDIKAEYFTKKYRND